MSDPDRLLRQTRNKRKRTDIGDEETTYSTPLLSQISVSGPARNAEPELPPLPSVTFDPSMFSVNGNIMLNSEFTNEELDATNFESEANHMLTLFSAVQGPSQAPRTNLDDVPEAELTFSFSPVPESTDNE